MVNNKPSPLTGHWGPSSASSGLPLSGPSFRGFCGRLSSPVLIVMMLPELCLPAIEESQREGQSQISGDHHLQLFHNRGRTRAHNLLQRGEQLHGRPAPGRQDRDLVTIVGKAPCPNPGGDAEAQGRVELLMPSSGGSSASKAVSRCCRPPLLASRSTWAQAW